MLATSAPAMARDDSRDPTPLRPESTRRSARPRGLLRRLLDGLRGASAPLASGDPLRLGRYRILHRLGQGGMGIVFAAEDESLGRRVAVKTISEPDESARKRFRREARAAARVNHPNVCQVYEIGEDSGQLYIVMELLEGETLSSRLQRGAMSLAEVLKLAQGMLAALQALHEAGTLHRDLKPSNTFLTAHGVKLLDFGLARALPKRLTQSLAGESELTRPGLLVGTPRYMTPEQVLGDATGPRTDLFSTGAIVYEALAGRPAFVGSNLVEVLSATLHEEPPALAGDAAVVALDRLIRRALAKRPRDRPPSAAAMLEELSAISPDGSGASRAVARPLTRLAVLPFRLLRPDPEIEFLSFALADAVSASLAGLPSLLLRSSASVARFASDAPDLKALASQADVDHALTGTLLRAGDQLRVTTQLVEAPSGTLVTSHTLQSAISDLFRLQDELSRRIVGELSPSLAVREGGPRRGVPANARAYEFYLRANEVGRDWAHAAVARDLYGQCVDGDPSFAPAWAKLGRCHRLLAKYYLEDVAYNLERAEQCFRRALELDPELSVAHKLYAQHQSEMGRSRDAMTGLLRLARKNPNDPEIFAGLVHACRYSGLLDASLAAHREARRLDAHAPTSVIFTWWAHGELERVAETADAGDFELRACALIGLGRPQEARETLETFACRPLPRVFDSICRGLLALLAGEPGAIARFAETLKYKQDPEAFFLFSGVEAYFGDAERALADLTRSVEGGFSVPRTLREHPWLATLRSSPRFTGLVEQAEAGRRLALDAFHEAGGEELLGASFRLEPAAAAESGGRSHGSHEADHAGRVRQLQRREVVEVVDRGNTQPLEARRQR